MDKKINDIINEQINKEIYSEYYYYSMAAYFKNEGLDGFANYFMVQAEEEHFHAMKFFNYVYERGGQVIVEAIKKPPTNFENAADVFKKALEHEQFVTASINNIMDIARDIKDYAAQSFLNWYIDEQVEEEDNMRTLLDKVTIAANHPNAMFMLDEKLGMRAFTPPPAN